MSGSSSRRRPYRRCSPSRSSSSCIGAIYPAPRPADEIIELVGLTEKAGERVRKLSGGQQRRLDVALGLVGDPELIFLDEPTTGFDPSARRAAWEVVRNMRTLGKTIVLTTHYMDEAQYLADRICVIAAGKVVAEGTPETLRTRTEQRTHIRFELARRRRRGEGADRGDDEQRHCAHRDEHTDTQPVRSHDVGGRAGHSSCPTSR